MPFSKDARGVLDETRLEKKNFLRLRIFDVNRFSSALATTYNFQVLDLHYLVRRRAEHRSKDGMHYDASIHREISTHIARYISCGLGLSAANGTDSDEDHEKISGQALKSIVDKLDYQLEWSDRRLLDEHRRADRTFFPIDQLNAKEESLLYLIDNYESHHARI